MYHGSGNELCLRKLNYAQFRPRHTRWTILKFTASNYTDFNRMYRELPFRPLPFAYKFILFRSYIFTNEKRAVIKFISSRINTGTINQGQSVKSK